MRIKVTDKYQEIVHTIVVEIDGKERVFQKIGSDNWNEVQNDEIFPIERDLEWKIDDLYHGN